MIEEEDEENHLLLNFSDNTPHNQGDTEGYHTALKRKQSRMMFETTESGAAGTRRWDTHGGYDHQLTHYDYQVVASQTRQATF